MRGGLPARKQTAREISWLRIEDPSCLARGTARVALDLLGRHRCPRRLVASA